MVLRGLVAELERLSRSLGEISAYPSIDDSSSDLSEALIEAYRTEITTKEAEKVRF